jgi:hypothetical protein
VLVSDRKRITVMAGETPLYDASIAADGDVFLEQPYLQPATRPVRYERAQLADLERRIIAYHDQNGNGLTLTDQSDAERSAPIRDAIDAERAQREQLIAAGVNRHGRRRRERLARRKP